ncbi:hypothetical protein DFQ26_001121 [Actinomortierella ambigua]|nr:hypothetical protein DFQ26_001121 [Actinomortierella ambigua]
MTPAEVTFSTSNSIKLSGQGADRRHGLWASVPGEAYSIHAVSTDQRLKALATVSMAATLPVCLVAFPRDRFEAAQVAADEARTHYARTGSGPIYSTLALHRTQLSADAPALMREGSGYYMTSRGWPCSIDQQDGRLGATNISRTMIRFCKIEHIVHLAPFLLVAGEVTDTLKYSQRALEKALELKEPFLVLGASHIELYDRKVSQVAHKVVDFFKKSL